MMKSRIVVVGASEPVGSALCELLASKGAKVQGVQGADVPERVMRKRDVKLMYVDTSLWWGSGERVTERDYAAYRRWFEQALASGVQRIGVITSAATCGEAMEQGELSLYVPGEGRAWEDDVWRFEAEGYHYMNRGAQVWWSLPTMVLASKPCGLMARWLDDGGSGDVVGAMDVARGCVSMIDRGRAGRRYVMSGVWVEREHGEREYLSSRRYEGDATQGELGYGCRLDRGEINEQIRKRNI